jgi:hypothetical protein
MLDQYIIHINNINSKKIELGKSTKHQEDAISFVHETAHDIIRKENGKKHLDYILKLGILNEQEFNNIKTDTEYPSGLYIKVVGHFIELYEKKINQPKIIHTINKSVVWDYKFTNKPLIKYIVEDDKFPTSNLYGFVISTNNEKHKIIVKDTFKGTIYNYDAVKTLYDFTCDKFYMTKQNNITQHNNNDIIYYINHEEESFIIELVKGVINTNISEQYADFNLVAIIGYNKITIELPYVSNSNNKKKTDNIKPNITIIKTDHGAVFGQLSDIFKQYDIDDKTEQFKPSMLKKKLKIEQITTITNNFADNIVEKIIEKDITESIEFKNISIGILSRLYFEHIDNIEKNIISTNENPLINKYITSLNDIINLNLSEIIEVYKLLSDRLSSIINKNDIIDNYNTTKTEKSNSNKKIIKKKFKKPSRNAFALLHNDSNKELFELYKKNKNIIDDFLLKHSYNTWPLETLDNMNQYENNYWARVINFAIKNIDIKNITIQEIAILYAKFKTSFDDYFCKNNIILINNFHEMLEWNELTYDDIHYINNIFVKALKHVDIVRNVIDIKE